MQIIFLCGARDFHAMDWYRSALRLFNQPRPIIITDLIGGEGYKILIDESDIVIKLFLLDKYLFRTQSSRGNVWRNILKALAFPLQVMLIRKIAARHRNAIYYAHSMYYIWLAWASGLQFVGTPQGSDILLKPYKSRIFKILSSYAMRSALFITVDSSKMADGVERLTGERPMVVQNGIDLNAISRIKKTADIRADQPPRRVVSFRGFTDLYRISQIICARNCSRKNNNTGLTFIYPFHDDIYKNSLVSYLREDDLLLGRLSRDEMYRVFHSMLLGISIPSSDSSPRTVYEAIFCDAIVAIAQEQYYFDLPLSMKSRIILVDLGDEEWFDKATERAESLRQTEFAPCDIAISMFDQLLSFQTIHLHAINKIL